MCILGVFVFTCFVKTRQRLHVCCDVKEIFLKGVALNGEQFVVVNNKKD